MMALRNEVRRSVGERVEMTLSNLGDAVITTDDQGRVSFMSALAESLTGWSRAEALAMPLPGVFQIVDVTTRQPLADPSRSVLADGAVVQRAEGTILISKGRLERPVDHTAAPIRSADGRIVGCVILFQDASERKRAHETQVLLASIVEASDDAIVSKTLDGIIRSWNTGAEQLFGFTAAEAIGKPITIIIPPEFHDEERSILQRLSRGERIAHYETVRVSKDGRRIDISLTVSPLRDRAGRVIGASKVARDITAQKRAQEERERLLASERAARAEAERASRLKDEFLATLSHELRTPLNAVLGWTKILQRKPPTPETLREGLAVIDRNGRLQAQLVSDLLDMSRIISGKMRLDIQPVELRVVIEAALDSIRPAADGKEIEIQSDVMALPGVLYADPARLQQIVWNLLSNAVKFTPRGGRVRLGAIARGSEVEILVTDTGKGIKPQFLPHVFERFRQADSSAAREHGGLGLGLSIVKQLTELHGGSVSVSSEGEGRGAVFAVRLPLGGVRPVREFGSANAHSLESTGPLELELPELAGSRILVLDDEVDARDLTRRLLEECEATVFVASSAQEALAIVEREALDLIVSDIGLPEEDGNKFLRTVRGRGSTIPAVALTAFARPDDVKQALRAGYQAHIAKPVDPAEFLAAIAALAKKSEEQNTAKDAR